MDLSEDENNLFTSQLNQFFILKYKSKHFAENCLIHDFGLLKKTQEQLISRAYKDSINVVVFISCTDTRMFYAVGSISHEPLELIYLNVDFNMKLLIKIQEDQKKSLNIDQLKETYQLFFKVKWVVKNTLSYDLAVGVDNPLNEGKAVFHSKEVQEMPRDRAEKLYDLIQKQGKPFRSLEQQQIKPQFPAVYPPYHLIQPTHMMINFGQLGSLYGAPYQTPEVKMKPNHKQLKERKQRKLSRDESSEGSESSKSSSSSYERRKKRQILKKDTRRRNDRKYKNSKYSRSISKKRSISRKRSTQKQRNGSSSSKKDFRQKPKKHYYKKSPPHPQSFSKKQSLIEKKQNILESKIDNISYQDDRLSSKSLSVLKQPEIKDIQYKSIVISPEKSEYLQNQQSIEPLKIAPKIDIEQPQISQNSNNFNKSEENIQQKTIRKEITQNRNDDIQQRSVHVIKQGVVLFSSTLNQSSSNNGTGKTVISIQKSNQAPISAIKDRLIPRKN